jgi:hypothetical protein
MSGHEPFGGHDEEAIDAEMREIMQRHAAGAPQVDLTEATLRRARRIRLHRRLTTGAAALAVAAVVVPVAATVVGGSDTSPVAGHSTTPLGGDESAGPSSGTATSRHAPVTVVAFDGLRQGQAPSVPYIFKTQLLVGSSAEAVPGMPDNAYDPKEPTAVVDAARFADGVGGFVANSSEHTLTFRASSSTALPSVKDTVQPAIDTDGEVAFAVNDVDKSGQPSRSSTILLADSLSGDPRYAYTDQLTVRQVMDAHDGVVLFNAVTSSGDQVVGSTDLHAGSPATVEEPWPNLVSLSAADQADGLMVGRTTSMGPGEHHCSAMLSTDDASELWRSCDWRPTEFSPDGTRVFAVALSGDDVGPDMAILDAKTGAPIREFTTPGRFGRATFEADNSLDIITVVDRESAIVRCTEGGQCELATVPQPAKQGSLVVPYQLTANP